MVEQSRNRLRSFRMESVLGDIQRPDCPDGTIKFHLPALPQADFAQSMTFQRVGNECLAEVTPLLA